MGGLPEVLAGVNAAFSTCEINGNRTVLQAISAGHRHNFSDKFIA